MTPEQFVYWLQGYAEINSSAPTEEQWKVIKDHLTTVFVKITPKYEGMVCKKDPLGMQLPIFPQIDYFCKNIL